VAIFASVDIRTGVSALTDVQVSVETGAGLERRLRIQVPAGRIEEEVELRLRNAGRTVNLKGFRRGKVPVQVIRQRFGEQIRQEVLQDMVQSSYSEAIARENLRPAGNPRIEAESPKLGEDFSYTAVLEVYPEFQVAGLDAMKIERPEVTVTETDIDRTVERLQRQRGSWKGVDRPSAEGDKVVIDFEGRLDGEIIEGGKAEKLDVVIGEGRMLRDFETNLAGIGPGGSKRFTVRFPADYHDQKLRDQDVVFEVSVREVAMREAPEVDGEFIKGYGVTSGDLAEFRSLVRENLQREAASRAQADMRRQIMECLLAANPVELPSVMVGREAASLQSEGMRNMGIRDVKDAPPLEAYRDVAERRVRLGLIIGALIREHDLKIEQARVDKRLEDLCQAYERPDEVKGLYLQNPTLMGQIENSVMEEQTMAWLIDRADVKPKTVALAELMGA
jgi:trigger factor